ncbi:MAG TPA: hypothetical protein VF545_13680 [Thermoleophilaceae bacterium]
MDQVRSTLRERISRRASRRYEPTRVTSRQVDAARGFLARARGGRRPVGPR